MDYTKINAEIIDSYEKLLVVTNKLPFNPLKDPKLMEKLMRDNDGVQFSHTFDEQIGGQLKAGLVITAAYEDYNNDLNGATDGLTAFWATRVVKGMSEALHEGVH